MRDQEAIIIEREEKLREWFTRNCDPIQKAVDGLDVGWGGVQRWATTRMPLLADGLHLDVACGYATFLAELGWRFPTTQWVGLNIDFDGPHALARPLLIEAKVTASLVQADARRLPFAEGAFGSASCFLGLQDIEIGFGARGVRDSVAEIVRVLCSDGVLVLLDEFPFERFEDLSRGLPMVTTDRAERTPDARWDCQVAERAIQLYAEGWVAQAHVADQAAQARIRDEVRHRMAAEMERQLATQGYYVPFGPVRMIVARKLQLASRRIMETETIGEERLGDTDTRTKRVNN